MDCTRVEELLALFSGGDLDARQTEAVRAHLLGCPVCQAQANELAASRTWLQTALPPQFDEAFYADLRQSVLRELPSVKEAGGRFAWLAGFLPQGGWQPVWAAAAALLLVAGWAVYRNVVGKSQSTSSVYTVVRPSPAIPAMTTPSPAASATATPSPAASATATPSPAAPPPDVRKVSDLPRQGLLSYRGYAPDLLGRSPRASMARLPVGRRPTAHQAAVPQEVLPQTSTDPALVAQVTGQNTGVTKPAPAQEPEVMRMEIQTADPNIRIIWLTPKATATNPTEPLTK